MICRPSQPNHAQPGRRSLGPAATSIIACSIAGSILILVTGCASGQPNRQASAPAPSSATSNPDSSSTSGSAAGSPTGSAGSSASGSAAAGEPADVTVRVSIAGGRVDPLGESVRISRGQRVAIEAASDVADSLHVHGYDRTIQLQPGQPTREVFTADQPGVFEIETHESARLVVKLIVS